MGKWERIKLGVQDVVEQLGVSRSYAYRLIRRLNDEPVETGNIVIPGKVSAGHFNERLAGKTANPTAAFAMSVSKDSKCGTWYVRCWYRDWQNERHKKTKRGFKSKKDAEIWERDFFARSNGAPTMTFGELCDFYAEGMKPRLKRNAWLTKEHMIGAKILPHFKNKAVNEIKPTDIIKWENKMLESRTFTGHEYTPTYLRAVSNQLSAILNHAAKFYGLDYNPMTKVERIGAKSAGEIQYWTKDEHLAFSKTVMDKPESFLAFEPLYWTGMRIGELPALTSADFDLRNQTVKIANLTSGSETKTSSLRRRRPNP